ncbi:alpha/beta hydrolase [Cerasibacillus terrae]|uniref:Alpha/beta hydrolase n=1 Tax=Cerasibacillus terrae TaxID=2498845 RepID=A0A5C8NUV4_9BACI|nr:alpha/beta hydrolase [Cerasibacillus terrae]TXL64963.1 alpha/beta hydrolase [Cerasibacillus terrae]
MKESFWLTVKDDVPLHVIKWFQKEQKPKAIIQLSHGMVEHIDRYDEFAKFLVSKQIYVYGNDHRGHGETGKNQGLLGYFSGSDGFRKVADDLYEVTKKIKKDYPHTPIILLGHSMGSFLARKYIQTYSEELDGVILSGTTYASLIETKLGKVLAAQARPKEKAELLNKLIFGTYNKGISKPNTEFDWLSRDTKSVQAYMDDPLCGFVPTGRFFYDLFTGLEMIHDTQLNQHIRRKLPMLFISGDKDPVGKNARNIWKAAQVYHDLNMENIMVTLVHGGRHEILNETNKSEVYSFIFQWIISLLNHKYKK